MSVMAVGGEISGLACPDCRGALQHRPAGSEDVVACSGCHRTFERSGGVLVLHPTSVPDPSREDIRAWDEPDSGRVEHRASWRALLAKEPEIRHLDRLLASRDWSDHDVLEIGGGLCWGSLVIKDHFPTADVTATDVAASALGIARRTAKALALEADRYLAVDSHRLPFTDDSFDAVFGSEVLHHLQDPLAALREIRRVLRPGGHYLGSGEGAASRPMQWLLDRTGMRRKLGGEEATSYGMREALYTSGVWRQFFVDAGFSHVAMQPESDPTLQYQGRLRLYYYCALDALPVRARAALGCSMVIDATK